MAARQAALRLAPDVEDLVQRVAPLLNESTPIAESAVWKLIDANSPAARRALSRIALDIQSTAALCAAAIVGLGEDVATYRSVIGQLTRDEQPDVAKEAKRLLASSPTFADHPAADDLDQWMELVGEGGDPEAGQAVVPSASRAPAARAVIVTRIAANKSVRN